jgi:hypothetical protein
MDRTALIENIQHKIAQIENKEVLQELETMIDEMVLLESELNIPSHVQESMTRATKELNDGKGIAHEKVWSEIQSKYQKSE